MIVYRNGNNNYWDDYNSSPVLDTDKLKKAENLYPCPAEPGYTLPLQTV